MGIKIDVIKAPSIAPRKSKNPQSAEALCAYAYLLVCRGYFSVAENLLLIGSKTYPKEARLLAMLGLLYAETNEEQKAIDAFKQALAQDQNNPDANYYLGFLENDTNRIEKAAKYYAIALDQDQTSQEKARLANGLGQCFMILNDMPNALDVFMIAFNARPDYEVLLANLGSYYLNLATITSELDLGTVHEFVLTLLNKAFAFAEKVLGVKAEKVDRQSSVGEIVSKLNNLALLMFERSIILNPNYSMAQLSLGMYHLSEKNYDKAEKYFQKAIELNPRCCDAHFNLGLTILFKAKIGDFKQAEIELDEAIRLGYKKGNDVFFVAQLLLTTKSFGSAKKWFKTAYDIYCKAGNKELFIRQFGQMIKELKDEEVRKQGRVILESL